MRLSLLAISSTLFSLAFAAFAPSISTFGDTPASSAAKVQFTSTEGSLDWPKISLINSSVYDWWYFDAVTPDLEASLQIIFFLASETAFPLILGDPSAVSVVVFASFPNGTSNEFVTVASEAQVASGGFLGDAVAVNYTQANASFVGTPGLTSYQVSLNWLDSWGIVVNLAFESLAPAHYPCSLNWNPGQNLEIFPNLGWSNAMPLASVTGDFFFTTGKTTNGVRDLHRQKFLPGSTGYHDKNWGAVPFYKSVHTWWWGRTSLGPFSIVFFYGLDVNMKVHAASYVYNTENGQYIDSNCKAGKTTVVPTYKDPKTKQKLDSVKVTINPIGSPGPYEVTIKAAVPIVESAIYSRWLGRASGGLKGGKQYNTGVAVFEQFPALAQSG